MFARHFGIQAAHGPSFQLELWVMADSKAPLGLHETVFWLNDTAAADTLVRPVRVTIDVVSQA